jgi:death-on-curing protein
MELTFLSLAEVVEIHRDQIPRYGGAPGIRDLGLLRSALAMPAATFGGAILHTDIHEMAAAYLFHLVKDHPFIDGNKRTGTVAALVFLALNGYECRASEDELTDTVLQLAAGRLDKSALIRLIRASTARLRAGDR